MKSMKYMSVVVLVATIIALFDSNKLDVQAVPRPANNAALESGQNSQVCLQRATQLDKCLPKLVVYGDREFDPPRSDEELNDHCLILDENLKCVSSYSRECLPSFARNLYSVVTRRLKTQFGKRCKTADGRRGKLERNIINYSHLVFQCISTTDVNNLAILFVRLFADFLNLMACADRSHMEPAHKCMDSFISHLEHIGNSGNQNRQIELTCCTFQIFQECIFTASKRNECPQRIVSAEKSIDYVRTIINSMGGDMMDLMCGKYDKVSTCTNGYPKIMSEFKSISERVLNGTLKAKANSPFKPMLQLFIDVQEE